MPFRNAPLAGLNIDIQSISAANWSIDDNGNAVLTDLTVDTLGAINDSVAAFMQATEIFNDTFDCTNLSGATLNSTTSDVFIDNGTQLKSMNLNNSPWLAKAQTANPALTFSASITIRLWADCAPSAINADGLGVVSLWKDGVIQPSVLIYQAPGPSIIRMIVSQIWTDVGTYGIKNGVPVTGQNPVFRTSFKHTGTVPYQLRPAHTKLLLTAKPIFGPY